MMCGVEAGAPQALDCGWRMAVGPAGGCAVVADALSLPGWIAAEAPGAAAGALDRAGLFDPASPTPLHDKDIWFSTEFSGEGDHVLVFEGLATLCEVFLDDALILSSDNMFRRHEVAVALRGAHRLTLAFRALTRAFAARGKGPGQRARWRTQLTPNQGARLVRTTLLGQTPGWHPQIEAVGPWRPISLIPASALRTKNLRVQARLDGEEGRLSVSARIAGAKTAILVCGDRRVAMRAGDDGAFSGALTIEQVKAWLPHTHGTPFLYPLAIEADGAHLDLGGVGFRSLELSRGADGKDFALRVNGLEIFCRGAVWTNADLVNLPGGAEHYEPWLRLARDADMNMIRVSGIMAYESRAFFELCDQLGLLVWSDFMFANFDYPATTESFADSCRREAEDFLEGIQGCPSLAMLCGGSEIRQQAAMMGLPLANISAPLTESLLPDVSAQLRPDVPYVPDTPGSEPLPFSTGQGHTHYYGVGAYQRPLEDARRARVRFAAECLAFANLPRQATLDARLPGIPPHHPRWKAGVPRDNAASWDFEDVREFYLADLFGVDPAKLRRENIALWRDLSRAVSVEVMESVFAEWRSVGSSCHGALVWTLQDLVPGAGWGVIDSDGAPKPAYYGLKRAFRSRQVVLSDEGADGLLLHVLNESGEALRAKLALTLLKDGRQAVIRRERPVEVAARGALAISATELIGAFFDTTYAFRFGPPGHDAAVAQLVDAETGALLAEAFHFPLGRAMRMDEIPFGGRLLEDGDGWALELETPSLLRFVHIDAPGFRAEDDWFHLAPGGLRRIRLFPAGTTGKPEINISALNSSFRLTVSA